MEGIHFPMDNRWTKIEYGESGRMMRWVVTVEYQIAKKWQEVVELDQLNIKMMAMKYSVIVLLLM